MALEWVDGSHIPAVVEHQEASKVKSGSRTFLAKAERRQRDMCEFDVVHGKVREVSWLQSARLGCSCKGFIPNGLDSIGTPYRDIVVIFKSFSRLLFGEWGLDGETGIRETSGKSLCIEGAWTSAGKQRW